MRSSKLHRTHQTKSMQPPSLDRRNLATSTVRHTRANRGMVKTSNTALRPVIVEKLSEEARSEIREKLIHLLATKPFGLAELFARLKTDGLPYSARDLIPNFLMATAVLQGNVYNLRRNVWYDVKDDWPHYTESEREHMKRRKQQILNPTQISKENAISTDQTRAPLTSSIKLSTSQCLPVKRKSEFEKTHYEPVPKKRSTHISIQCSRKYPVRPKLTTTSASSGAGVLPDLINNEDYYHPSAFSGAAGLPELNENENYYDPKKPKQRISHIK
ncbi:RNA polymerase II elongation factor ELL2-like [Ceratitis capitata]|uniref:RNA polymerase II elongation factor ELL2-like n=1 Tax=Ceratitis capitata TaxID=7213 RepID=UPI000618883A|nr:RNA polymerase II elongation factor ELL2-like [Ceratitis capitata]